jgi:hypothetical protein
MLFYHKGLRGRKKPLSFVAGARKAAILRVQIRSAHESDVVGIICAPAKDIGQHPTAPVIDGMPEPSLLFFLTDKRPHFIDFCFIRALDNDLHIAGGQSVHQGFVDTDQRRCFFFNSLMTVVGLIFNTRAVSRMPLPLRLMSTMSFLIAGKRPLYMRSS